MENEEKLEDFVIDPMLEKFLDADTFEDKLEVFYGFRNRTELKLLSDIAMSLDIQLTKQTYDEQYLEILGVLRTVGKYEGNRLRSK